MYVILLLLGRLFSGMSFFGDIPFLKWTRLIPLIIILGELVFHNVSKNEYNFRMYDRALLVIGVIFGIEGGYVLFGLFRAGFAYVGKFSAGNFWSFFISFVLFLVIMLVYFFLAKKTTGKTKFSTRGIASFAAVIGVFVILTAISNIQPFFYKQVDGGIELTGISPLCVERQVVTLPDTLGNKPVVSVGGHLLSTNTTMKEVVIPSTVTKIGDGAFYYCINLNKITFLGDKLEIVEDNAFYYCKSLSQGSISYGIVKVGDSAFYNCALTLDVSSWTKLTEIGSYAFAYTSGIDRFVAPDSLTAMGDHAFYGCENLEYVEFGDDSQVKTIEKATFVECPKLSRLDFNQAKITRINEFAFSYNPLLTQLTLNEHLTVMEPRVFVECSVSQVIIEGDNLIKAGEQLFNKLSYTTAAYTIVPERLIIFVNPSVYEGYLNSWKGYVKNIHKIS